MMTRRDSVRLMAAGSAAPLLVRAAQAAGWTPDWDKALLEAALGALEGQFDSSEAMLVRQVGAAYDYHSALRNTSAHPTRQSLEYALLLLEGRRDDRAQAVIGRVLSLQDTDPQSQWYGIWGYYAEEPPPKMAPADWNWADFNGATLLMIAFRHGERLAPSLRERVHQAIRHAAASVRKRNVSMSYTNIAVQGTFVTLAAAQLLDDKDLRAYAADRLRRLAAAIDETGSFAEYNSPPYARLTIANLTRMRMMLKDPAVLDLAARIHHRAWLHLAEHWHPPTMQLAAPHSRCYSTDIGRPVWLQKALAGQVAFFALDKLSAAAGEGEVAVLDYACPRDLQSLFWQTPVPHLHREVFLPGTGPGRSTAGTTWLEPRFCLGTANRADFWVQRRPLVAYWGNATRPARYAQLRFLKDSYDFSSALFYSVQEQNYVLGFVNFRSPGGDRHISLDPIQNGQFDASRFRLRLDLANLGEDAKVLTNGKPVFGNLETKSLMSFDLDGAWLHFQVRGWGFGKQRPSLSLSIEDNRLALSLDLIGGQTTIRWSEFQEAWVAFTFCITSGKDDRSAGFDAVAVDGRVRLTWKTPAGVLSLTGATRVATVEDQDAAFEETLNGTSIAWPRLSDERLIKKI